MDTMKKLARLAAILIAATALAQNGPGNQANVPVTSTQFTVPLLGNPDPAYSATIAQIGVQGPQVIYYWISANYLVGKASLAGPFVMFTAVGTLSSSNYVTINPVLSPSATSYDVLKTSTPNQPTGACGCAVATAVSPGTVTNDQSNSTSAYTVNPLTPATLTETLTNEAQSAGQSHLILRQAGVFVSDLNTGGAGGLPSGCANGQTAQFNGTTWVCANGGVGTVTQVQTGAGLTGGPITGSGTLAIPNGGVTNAMLVNSSVTVTAGSGLAGGGATVLGSTVTVTLLQTCSMNQVEQWNGTTWVCATISVSGGANTALGNLTSVAVNTALVPALDNAISLDSPSLRYVNSWWSGVTGWTNGSGTADTGLSRGAADTVDCGNGTAGNTSCTLNVATLNGTTVDATTSVVVGSASIAGCGGAGSCATFPEGATSGIGLAGSDVFAFNGLSTLVSLNNNTPYVPAMLFPLQGGDSKVMTAGTISGSAGTPTCLDGSTGLTTVNCPNASALPATVSGTITSGGIRCFNSTTTEESSGLLGANWIVYGGGVGGCPAATGNATLSGATLSLGNAVLGNVGTLTLNGSISGGFSLTVNTSASTLSLGSNASLTAAGALTVVSCTGCGGGGGGTVTVVSSGTLASTAIMTGGGSQASQTPCSGCTLSPGGNMVLTGTLSATIGTFSGAITTGSVSNVCGSASPCLGGAESTSSPTPTATDDFLFMSSTAHAIELSVNGSTLEPIPALNGSFTPGHALVVNAQLGSGSAYDLADAGYSATAIPLADLAPGTANTLIGFNGSGVASGVTIGSGLSLSGGTLTASGGGGGAAKSYVTSTFTNTFSSSYSGATITGLSFSISASTHYTLTCDFNYQASVGTALLNMGLTGPASPTLVTVTSGYDTGGSATTISTFAATQGTSFPAQFGRTSGTTTVAATNVFHFVANIDNGTNSGTLQVVGGAEGTGTVTINANSSGCVLN